MTRTKKIVTASLLAAFTCVATMLIKIPSPLQGYINLGDCAVLLSGFMLSPIYGFFAAGFGSALADIFSGYALYAPATLIIKGVMALICSVAGLLSKKRLGDTASKIIFGALSEIFMILGYYVFEGFMYGFAASAVNIPSNAVQGAVGLVLGILLSRLFEKHKIF